MLLHRKLIIWLDETSQVSLMVKSLSTNAGDIGDLGSIPESGRSPREGNSNPLQYSCLETLMDRGAWRAIAHRVAKSQTRLKQVSMHVCLYYKHFFLSYSLPFCFLK